MDAKQEILERIRAATSGNSSAPQVIPRDYEHAPTVGSGSADLFAHTVDDYRAQVFRITESEIESTIAGLLDQNAVVAVPPGISGSWVTGLTLITDGDPHMLSTAELDCADAVVTGCRLGIAVTGTIVLDAGAGQGRRALTLVPDHHICVVYEDQVVDTVPQAFSAVDPLQPLTFISGPSATSDIELNRVEGVHGPRTLDVLIVSR